MAIKLVKNAVRKAAKFAAKQIVSLVTEAGPPLGEFLSLPFKLVAAPFAITANVVRNSPRGFGIPAFASRVSFSTIFLVAAAGTFEVTFELGKKVLCRRDCDTCCSWQALRCTMCKGTGKATYKIKNFSPSSERATAEQVAGAIVDKRADLVHIPSALSLSVPLPSTDCPTCDGTGVMRCPHCKNGFQFSISADNILEPPWVAADVMRKMDYPYEEIRESMKDPKVAEFWLITLPQIVGGFKYDEDVKNKIWWVYKEQMPYYHLRDLAVIRKPGWEHLQDALVSLDPVRARNDPAVIKNVPYYKAKKALESEVMMLEVPPRPHNWGQLDMPFKELSWSDEELKDPNKSEEITALLIKAQKEVADKILDTEWEAQWRENKLNELLKEKVQPYVQDMEKDVLPEPFLMQSNIQDKPRKRERRWFFF
ncbi:Embryo defective 2737 [Rhynchospora pubera]|uniref:Embryo defective 2737 n=1 Tax=Rhynchospora pubera TaxID=906938 RepID=A0AAV8EPE9_9POAL|nr:Embryo defective 2737 [Rhynchospora pubera]